MVRSRAKLAGLIDKLQGVFHFDSAGSVVVIAGLSLLGSFLWIAAVKVVAVDLDINLSFTAMGCSGFSGADKANTDKHTGHRS